MTTESKRKNIDYTASAVNLMNSPILGHKLCELKEAQGIADVFQKALEDTEPYRMLARCQDDIARMRDEIHELIEEQGSFQDTEAGMYAVKQRRESITYKPELVRQYAPSKVASFVLVESVDSKALDAMLKAGQITPEQARQCGTIEEKFAFIIRV